MKYHSQTQHFNIYHPVLLVLVQRTLIRHYCRKIQKTWVHLQYALLVSKVLLVYK